MSKQRFRVKASRRTPMWFHAVEVTFLDAVDADDAKRQVEADPQLEVWAVTEATPEMEAQYRDWLQKCADYIAAAKTATAHRGIL